MATPDRKDACVVSIEVDGRQRYVFETDKLMEMLGASRIIAQTVEEAETCFTEPLHLLNPVSGEIRAWADIAHRDALLDVAWGLRTWLHERGVEHTCAYMETDKRHFLIDAEAAPNEQLSPQELPGRPSLGWVHRAIGAMVSARKAGKTAGDARPTCSLFAPCRIHPADAANEWRALKGREDEREPRRNQRGFRAIEKHDLWTEVKQDFYNRTLAEPVWRRALGEAAVKARAGRPITFTDLADQLDDPNHEDQFIAFLCGDGDDMGRVLTSVNWNHPRWYAECPPTERPKPWMRSAEFARTLDRCVREAFSEAIADVTVTPELVEKLQAAAAAGTTPDVPLPCLPQLTGGDDIWAVARRDVALQLASCFSIRFQDLVSKDPKYGMLRRATELVDPKPTLSISLGIAFAKAGHPAHAMIEAAETLLASGKTLRKGQVFGRGGPKTAGCIDWHWIESSLSESVKEARGRGWSYQDPDERTVLVLTTRPWEANQCGPLIEAARFFRDAVPRRKREQLDAILRRGRSLSLLAWTAWLKGLRPIERESLRTLGTLLESAGLKLETGTGHWQDQFTVGPWLAAIGEHAGTKYYSTPFLDLLALSDVLAAPAENAGDAETDQAETIDT
jgi:hypothetical protein